MSCRAMVMGGGIIVFGYLAVVAIYSCGPNVVVGAGGAIVTGISALKDKVNKAYLENRLESKGNLVDTENLVGRIQELSVSEKKNAELCSNFAISMIPFAGPFIVLFKGK